ncbi:hypothetical protein C8A05DRAFT_46597 [Staphylotrichum tortipilum]|uniref:DUF6594 domain-containing protein n=1 Tax=Staphylotrichum tortipilum TaxID=2831512 RepID=A0AAN6MEZ0_9PEZI|nr:hypothetical protein C8A05DRAFT_46597 [Staphylotrichum longicolle]
MIKDKNFAIFRRFDELNMLHLLALQAEIIELRELFRDQCCRDDQSDSGGGQPETMYSKYFHALRESKASAPRASDASGTRYLSSQLELITALQQRMGEYISKLARLPAPKKPQLAGLQGWLHNQKGGNNFLQGCEVFTWTEDDLSSYITVNPPTAEADIFTEVITDWLASILRRLFGRRFHGGKIVDEEAGLRSCSDTRFSKASNVIAVIVAGILPVLTIFILNSVKRTTVRIGLTLLFATIFAVVLALCTSVKPGEIFAATATFAAVEVVFIGSAISSRTGHG